MSRIAACTIVAAALALAGVAEAANTARANKAAPASKVTGKTTRAAKGAETTHAGKIVSIMEGKDGKDGKLIMSDADGKKEHSHAVLATTKITLNKKAGKLADLKKGDQVTVTLDSANKMTAVAATRDVK